MLLGITCILCAAVLKGCIATTTVYVSLNGQDENGCGSELEMCQSIPYAVKSISPQPSNITIYLDGGNNKTGYQYRITKSVNMSTIQSVALLRLTSSTSIPNIVGTTYPVPLFLFDVVPDLVIQNIEFKNMLLIKFSQKVQFPDSKDTARLYVNKSSFIGISYPYFPLIEQESVAIGKLAMKMKVFFNNVHSEGYNQYPLIKSHSKTFSWFVDITNSSFDGVGLSLPPLNNATLNMENISFNRFLPVRYVVGISGFKEVHIRNITLEKFVASTTSIIGISMVGLFNLTSSIFDNDYQDSLLVHAVQINNILIHNCTFTSLITHATTVISIMNSTNVLIKDCTITKVRSFQTSIAISHVKNAMIENCNFTKNYVTAIKCSANSNLTIQNNLFKENRAFVEAGAITTTSCLIKINSSQFVENYAPSAVTFYFDGDSIITISNTSIMSPSNDIPLYATIIESSGRNLTFQNVKVIILKSNNTIDIITNGVSIESIITYNCPKGTNLNVLENKVWSCKHCDKGQYSLDNSTMVYGSYHTMNHTYPKNHTIQCKNCPFGGQCEYGQIKSKANFWGYVDNLDVTFLHCPEGYCCGSYTATNNQTQCTSYFTCNNNRYGNICGKCEKHFYVDFFTSDCIPNTNCNKMVEFWITFFLLGFFVFLFGIYVVDIGRYLLKKLNIHKSKRLQLTKRLIETTTEDDDIDEESTDGLIDETMQKTAAGMSTTAQLMGVLKILVNFYQMNLLITIYHQHSHNNQFLRQFIPSIFNLKLTFKNISASYCPMKSLDAVTKMLIKDVLFIAFLMVIATVAMIIYKVVKHVKFSNEIGRRNEDDKDEDEQISFVLRCKVFILRLLMIGYTNITTFSLVLVNCVNVRNDSVLLINGELSCFQWYQYVDLVFVIVWVVPFSINLYFSSWLLQQRFINVNVFFFCLILPPVTPIYYVKNLFLPSNGMEEIEQSMRVSSDMSYQAIMDILEEPFRQSKTNRRIILWDSAILFRRFVVACLVTFISNPIIRLAVVCPVMLCFCFHHSRILPYKSYHLNLFETICFFTLSFLTCVDLYWAFFYVYSLPYVSPVSIIGGIFVVIETLLLLLPVIVLVLVVLFFVLRKLLIILYKKFVEKYK